jgi:hypothetical protein
LTTSGREWQYLEDWTNEKEVTPRGPWQATGMQKQRIPKDDPSKLRMRTEELKLKAARLTNEADELFARAEQIESAK